MNKRVGIGTQNLRYHPLATVAWPDVRQRRRSIPGQVFVLTHFPSSDILSGLITCSSSSFLNVSAILIHPLLERELESRERSSKALFPPINLVEYVFGEKGMEEEVGDEDGADPDGKHHGKQREGNGTGIGTSSHCRSMRLTTGMARGVVTQRLGSFVMRQSNMGT